MPLYQKEPHAITRWQQHSTVLPATPAYLPSTDLTVSARAVLYQNYHTAKPTLRKAEMPSLQSEGGSGIHSELLHRHDMCFCMRHKRQRAASCLRVTALLAYSGTYRGRPLQMRRPARMQPCPAIESVCPEPAV